MEMKNDKEGEEEDGERITEQLMTVKAEVTMIDTDSLGSNFEDEDMEEEGVMVTCGKLTLGPAIENPPTENLATENPATENPPTEETLAEVETITATDEVADNEMVNDSVKPGDEEVDPVQEI